MKNKKNMYIIYIMLIVIIITVFVLIKFYPNTIEEKILNKTWYIYDSNTGIYNSMIFSNNEIIYNYASNNNEDGIFDSCKTYSYDKVNNTINLDCNKSVKINKVAKDMLVLLINEKKYYFYLEPSKSLEHEFNDYFNKNITKYKNENIQNLDLIKINSKSFKEIFNTKEYSTFVIMNDMCTSVDCTLFLNILEKWISKKDDLYYINTEEFDIKTLNEFKKINIDLESLNDIYPTIIVINNKKIVDQYQIKCTGFNCSKYLNY